MMNYDTQHIKRLAVIVTGILLLSHVLATIFRYSKMPEWATYFQSAIFFLLLLYLLLWIISESRMLVHYRYTKIVILFIFISRGLIAVVNEHYQILPNLNDVSYYHHLGIDYSRDLSIQGGGIGASAFGNYFIGMIYFLLGASPVLISLINAFLYSITVLIIIMICKKLQFYNYCVVAFSAAILPSSFLYIPVVLRESLFLMFSVLLFYRLVVIYSQSKGAYYEHLLILLLLFITTFIRPQVLPLFLLIYVTLMIYYQRGIMKVVSAPLLFGSIVIISFFNLTLFQFISKDLLNLQYFQLYRNAFSDLPNAYLVNIAYHDWLDFFSYLPNFIAHFLIAPFPWISSNYKYFMITMDSMITMIIIMISIIILIRNMQKWKKHIIPTMLCFLIFVIPFSMIEASPSGAVRHRMLVILLMLPLLSCAFPRTNNLSIKEKYGN